MRLSLAPLALIVAIPAVAHADPVLTGGTIKFEAWVSDGIDTTTFHRVTENQDDRELEHRFNLARCVCGQFDAVDDPDTSYQLRLSYEPAPANTTDAGVQIWIGPDCGTADQTNRATTCGDLPKAEIEDADSIRQIERVGLGVYETINPVGGACSSSRDPFTQKVWAVTDVDPVGTFDDVFSWDVSVDTEVPPVPTKFTRATGGENAIEVSWESPTTSETDIDKWQLLCAKANGDPAFATPKGDKRWEAPADFCSGEQVEITPIPIDSAAAALAGDAGVEPDAMPAGPDLSFLPQPLQDLDASYVCGEAAATATKIRVEQLENNEDYYFVLLAVDKAGNAKGVTFAGALTPAPVTDFWEDLHESGSDVEGGFCLIADAYGDGGGPGGAITREMRAFRDDTLASSAAGRALIRFYYDDVAGAGSWARQSLVARFVLVGALLPLVAIAFLWHLLSLPGLLAVIALGLLARRARTRLRRALVAAGAFVAVLAGAGVASAQNFTPYWDDDTDVHETGGPDAIHWHVGVKFGPYLPEIDAQLPAGEGNGPYHQMFGGYNVLPMLEVDYLIWTPPGGQLGVGGTLGMLGKTGKALDAAGRPSEDETKFRLIPFAATAVYRMTLLDDEYGVPVLPYLRAGLAYYIWWITKPSGAVADYMGDKGRGATLGIQASAGLAVRAERIDPAAAASMRDSGLFHAGFYAEFQLGWVNGFGSDKKLAVGDKTWFAGFDFEF